MAQRRNHNRNDKYLKYDSKIYQILWDKAKEQWHKFIGWRVYVRMIAQN